MTATWLAFDLADFVARMMSGARIDCRAAPGVVLSHIRHAPSFPATGHEVGGVVVLVSADGAPRTGVVLDPK
jgi:hypothetical protein